MDKPGIIVRVKVIGNGYEDLITKAKAHFDNFYAEVEYDIIGAEIQEGEKSEGFGPEEIISWAGMFYAMPVPEQTDPETISSKDCGCSACQQDPTFQDDAWDGYLDQIYDKGDK